MIPILLEHFTHEDAMSKVDYSGFEGMERRGRARCCVVAWSGRLQRKANFIGVKRFWKVTSQDKLLIVIRN